MLRCLPRAQECEEAGVCYFQATTSLFTDHFSAPAWQTPRAYMAGIPLPFGLFWISKCVDTHYNISPTDATTSERPAPHPHEARPAQRDNTRRSPHSSMGLFHVTCLRACRRHSLRCWKRGLCAGRRVLQHRGREALQDEKPSAKAAGCSGVVLEFVSDWLLQLHGWRRDVLRAGRPGTQPLGFHTNGTGWVPAPKLHTC